MVDLLDKYAPLKERHDRLLDMGRDPINLVMEELLSPTRAIINGRETILAGTNNYLGITFEPSCINAAKQALERNGTGTTGSRVANGTYAEHKLLEREIAEFLNCREAIIFSTGFQANLSVIGSLAGKDDTIFIDMDSHASIYEGCKAADGARIIPFRHNSPEHLDKRLSRLDPDGPGGALVIVEGLYSMIGDVAPLAEFVEVKNKHGAQILVDDAHSFGVYGAHGRGLGEAAGVEADIDFIAGTFSKALGAIGGFAVSNHPMFEVLRYVARAYMFSASPSPAAVASTRAALHEIRTRPELRANLWRNSEYLHQGLRALGFDMCCDQVSPIAAVRVLDEPTAVFLWNRLIEKGVYGNLALPPGTPNAQCLIRCSVSAAHSLEELDKVIAAFGDTVQEMAEREGIADHDATCAS